MTLAARCGAGFSEQTKTRGRSYFRRGQVTLTDLDDARVEALVEGSRRQPYEVLLDWSDGDAFVDAICTCPHYADGWLCKHIWATILAADERGATASILGRGRVNVDYAGDDDDGFGYDERYYDDEDEPLLPFSSPAAGRRVQSTTPYSTVTASRGRKKSPRKVKPAGWKQVLAVAAADDQTKTLDEVWRKVEDRQRRLHFVLDLQRSIEVGTASIALFDQETRKDGTWGKIKSLPPDGDQTERFSDEDQLLLKLLAGNKVAYNEYGWYSDDDLTERLFSRVSLAPHHYESLLPRLCGTGRLGWVADRDAPPDEARPLAWDDGPPWQFRLVIDAKKQKKQWTVAAELHRSDERLAGTDTLIAFPTGLLLAADRIARFDRPRDVRWIHLLGQTDSLVIPHADKTAFLAELWRSGEAPEICGPAEVQLAARPGVPRATLKVQRAKKRGIFGSSGICELYGIVAFEYEGATVAPGENRHAWPSDDGQASVVRDHPRESELLKELAELKVRPSNDRYPYPEANVKFKSSRLDQVVERLAASGWRVEAEGQLIRTPGTFQLSITSGVDWFDLDGAVDFDETRVALPALLQAVRQGAKYVRLDDGSRGMLPAEWLQRFGPLADLATVEGKRLRFRPSQGLLLDALLSAQATDARVEVDRQFTDFRKKLRKFTGIQPAKAPRGFQGTLRAYQKDGLAWLRFLNEFRLGGCLADDMGLGKTVQVLALLAGRRSRRLKNGESRRPSLVVVPKSLAFNWREEAGRFAPRLKVVVYTGSDRKQRAGDLESYDLVITTYGTLRRDIGELKGLEFDYAILDESQAVKNASSQTAKACRLIRANHRLAMTGTPVENHLGELWSLFEFLNPGMLGRSTVFGRFAKQLTKAGENGSSVANLELLRQGLAPFILRRTKEQVLKDLPKKTEQTIHCQLDGSQRRKYDELRGYYRRSLAERIAQKGLKQSKIHVLEALLRLRQAACHLGLLDKKLRDQPSAKLDALVEQLREVVSEGHKALVFSQFTSLLSIVRDRLDADGIVYEYLDGRTRKRQARVERFQSDAACPLFLISLKAGGQGLNLTAADYVFLLDPWWNPAVEAQAIDRAHRIGQTRPVFAYRLIATDTVEDRIIELQSNKKQLADAIITADANLMRSLTADDLQLLLS